MSRPLPPALPIAAASLRRILRDRIGLFFIVVLPVVVILIIGATVRDFDRFRVGVVSTGGGPLGVELVDDLSRAPALQTGSYPDEATARTALRRGEVDAAVLVPSTMDAELRRGGSVVVPVLGAGPESNQQAVRSAVATVVARHAARVQAAAFAAAKAGGTVSQRLAAVPALEPAVPAITVHTEVVNSRSNILPAGFSYSAPTMLVLFVFVNAMAGGAALIQARKLGIYDRAMAAPVRARDIVAGETLCYLAMALLQSLLIVAVGAVCFGVSWGDPVAATVLIGLWALVGTGAGMLSGTLFRTPEQASAIGPAVGIGFGMLGGTMWPLEVVNPAMKTVGHLVPQAWAVDAWTVLLSRGGQLADIAGQIIVLAGFAAVLLAVATLRLGRRLVG